MSVALAAGGFDVAVLSRPAGEAGAPDGGVDHVAVPWSAPGRWLYERKRGWGPGHPLRPVVKALNVLAYGLTARRRLGALRPDIVYVHNDPYLAGLLGRRAGQSLVLHMHNDHLSARAARRCCARRGPLRRHPVRERLIRDRARAASADAGRIHTRTTPSTRQPSRRPRNCPKPAAPTPRRTSSTQDAWCPRRASTCSSRPSVDCRRTLPQARLTIAGSSLRGAPRTPFERHLRQQPRHWAVR
jgi:hypothetical protein